MPSTRNTPNEKSERYIQRQVVTFLRKQGWFVQIFSGSVKAMPGLAGHPDVMATRMRPDGNAVILYVECKAAGAGLRPSQEKWMKRALGGGLLGSRNVHYAVIKADDNSEFFRTYHIILLESGFIIDYDWPSGEKIKR